MIFPLEQVRQLLISGLVGSETEGAGLNLAYGKSALHIFDQAFNQR
jgi:hypothetical protein